MEITGLDITSISTREGREALIVNTQTGLYQGTDTYGDTVVVKVYQGELLATVSRLGDHLEFIITREYDKRGILMRTTVKEF